MSEIQRKNAFFLLSLFCSRSSIDTLPFFFFSFALPFITFSRSLSLTPASLLPPNSHSPFQQRKKPASATLLKPTKTEHSKRKAAANAAAAAAASSPSSTSTLPARLELACFVPGSSDPFVFVAEGSTRKFTVGRVKQGRSGLCLRDDQVSSKHAEIEWVPCEEGGAGAGEAGTSGSFGGGASGGGRGARARGGGKGSPSSPSPSSSAFRRPQAFGGAWVIHDMRSSNGTTINGLKAEPLEPYELKHTDEVCFGGSSRCSVSLSICEERLKTVTVEQHLAIEVGKKGDKCKADAERAAGELRARFRVYKEQLYRDAFAAWKAVRDVGGESSAAKLAGLAEVQRLKSGPLDGGVGGGGGGSGGEGKENTNA